MKRAMNRPLFALALLLAAGPLTACPKEEETFPPAPDVPVFSGLETEGLVDVNVGETRRFEVRVSHADGRPYEGYTFKSLAYPTNGKNVRIELTHEGPGLEVFTVTALEREVVNIQGQFIAHSGTSSAPQANTTVAETPAMRLRVWGGAADRVLPQQLEVALGVGEVRPLSAIAWRRVGGQTVGGTSILDIATASSPLVWTSDAPGVIEVSSEGVARGVAVGSTTLHARSDSAEWSTPATVTARELAPPSRGGRSFTGVDFRSGSITYAPLRVEEQGETATIDVDARGWPAFVALDTAEHDQGVSRTKRAADSQQHVLLVRWTGTGWGIERPGFLGAFESRPRFRFDSTGRGWLVWAADGEWWVADREPGDRPQWRRRRLPMDVEDAKALGAPPLTYATNWEDGEATLETDGPDGVRIAYTRQGRFGGLTESLVKDRQSCFQSVRWARATAAKVEGGEVLVRTFGKQGACDFGHGRTRDTRLAFLPRGENSGPVPPLFIALDDLPMVLAADTASGRWRVSTLTLPDGAAFDPSRSLLVRLPANAGHAEAMAVLTLGEPMKLFGRPDVLPSFKGITTTSGVGTLGAQLGDLVALGNLVLGPDRIPVLDSLLRSARDDAATSTVERDRLMGDLRGQVAQGRTLHLLFSQESSNLPGYGAALGPQLRTRQTPLLQGQRLDTGPLGHAVVQAMNEPSGGWRAVLNGNDFTDDGQEPFVLPTSDEDVRLAGTAFATGEGSFVGTASATAAVGPLGTFGDTANRIAAGRLAWVNGTLFSFQVTRGGLSIYRSPDGGRSWLSHASRAVLVPEFENGFSTGYDLLALPSGQVFLALFHRQLPTRLFLCDDVDGAATFRELPTGTLPLPQAGPANHVLFAERVGTDWGVHLLGARSPTQLGSKHFTAVGVLSAESEFDVPGPSRPGPLLTDFAVADQSGGVLLLRREAVSSSLDDAVLIRATPGSPGAVLPTRIERLGRGQPRLLRLSDGRLLLLASRAVTGGRLEVTSRASTDDGATFGPEQVLLTAGSAWQELDHALALPGGGAMVFLAERLPLSAPTSLSDGATLNATVAYGWPVGLFVP